MADLVECHKVEVTERERETYHTGVCRADLVECHEVEVTVTALTVQMICAISMTASRGRHVHRTARARHSVCRVSR